MLDQLRDQMSAYLAAHNVCLLITGAGETSCALPVRYRTHGLELECLLPTWADAAFHLEQNPAVLVIVTDGPLDTTRWLQYQGAAHFMPTTGTGLQPVRISPTRIDLIDQYAGWGARTTLEL